MSRTLGALIQHHPVLSILRMEQALEHNALLKTYIMVLINSHQEVPVTINELYGGYVNYVMMRNTTSLKNANDVTKNKQQVGDGWNDAGEIFAKFGHVAFDVIIRKRRLSREVLEKQYQLNCTNNPEGSDKDVTSTNQCHDAELGELESVPGTYGFIVPDPKSKRGGFRFRDNIIRVYLAAHYQLSEVSRKIKTERKKLLSSNLIESVRRLPGTGDLWRITIGLMVKGVETRRKQRALMIEILDYSKILITMSSYDMTSLCVESIYESRLASSISRKTLDDFTLNQTIDFSNVKVKPHRLNYSISAVGHLLRASGEVFGLHLANFGINESNIHLLADPLNVISDNSLQVLNLSGNELGEAGFIKLERFLVKASLLTHLDLSGCMLFDAGVIALSEILICLQLIYLNLNNNGITDLGMERVTRNLRYCPALEFLHVAGNRLTDESARSLGEVMKGLPRLRSLDLRRNQIGEDGVKSVSASSKNLKPPSSAENKGGSTRSRTVWKTRSAHISNFSLRKVPMAGVMKRSHQQVAPPVSDRNRVSEASNALPNLIKEKIEEEEEEDGEGEWELDEEQKEKGERKMKEKGKKGEEKIKENEKGEDMKENEKGEKMKEKKKGDKNMKEKENGEEMEEEKGEKMKEKNKGEKKMKEKEKGEAIEEEKEKMKEKKKGEKMKEKEKGEEKGEKMKEKKGEKTMKEKEKGEEMEEEKGEMKEKEKGEKKMEEGEEMEEKGEKMKEKKEKGEKKMKEKEEEGKEKKMKEKEKENGEEEKNMMEKDKGEKIMKGKEIEKGEEKNVKEMEEKEEELYREMEKKKEEEKRKKNEMEKEEVDMMEEKIQEKMKMGKKDKEEDEMMEEKIDEKMKKEKEEEEEEMMEENEIEEKREMEKEEDNKKEKEKKEEGDTKEDIKEEEKLDSAAVTGADGDGQEKNENRNCQLKAGEV